MSKKVNEWKRYFLRSYHSIKYRGKEHSNVPMADRCSMGPDKTVHQGYMLGFCCYKYEYCCGEAITHMQIMQISHLTNSQ